MFALLITPLTIASLMSATEVRTDIRVSAVADTIPASNTGLPSPADTSIPILNLDMVKRLAAVKNTIDSLEKKQPSFRFDNRMLRSAVRTGSYSTFEKSEEFAAVTQKHGFTVPKFFAAYSEVIGALYILKVEKEINQSNLTKAQGFKALPMNKRFVEKHKIMIDELKFVEPEKPRNNSNAPFEGGQF